MATAALFAFVLLMYAPTLVSYHAVWSAQPYTHGYLVALACAWLVWTATPALERSAEGWRSLLLPGAVLSMLWFAASAADVRFVHQTVVPIVLLCWCGSALGRQAFRTMAPVAATFLLAVPLWGILTSALQAMTIGVTGMALGLLRVPAELDGDMVHIASGSFIIEDGCAGLNYLMSGLTIGTLYAQILVTGWRRRLAVVGIAALVPIIGNWIRVTSLIVIGHRTAMESIFITEPRPHIVYGWSIFLLGLLVFFPLAARVTRGDVEGPTPEHEPAVGHEPSLRSAVMATVVVAIGPLVFYVLAALPARGVSPPAVGELARWEAANAGSARPYAWVPAFAGADERYSAPSVGESRRVSVDRFVYRSQAQGAELIGYGNAIAADSAVLAQRVVGLSGSDHRIVNEAIVLDVASGAPVLVWYWYRIGGVETASPLRAKLLEVWAFVRRARVSELIAVSAACAPEGCAEASKTLSEFFDDA